MSCAFKLVEAAICFGERDCRLWFLGVDPELPAFVA